MSTNNLCTNSWAKSVLRASRTVLDENETNLFISVGVIGPEEVNNSRIASQLGERCLGFDCEVFINEILSS